MIVDGNGLHFTFISGATQYFGVSRQLFRGCFLYISAPTVAIFSMLFTRFNSSLVSVSSSTCLLLERYILRCAAPPYSDPASTG